MLNFYSFPHCWTGNCQRSNLPQLPYFTRVLHITARPPSLRMDISRRKVFADTRAHQWRVCLLRVPLSLLIAPSSVRSGRPFISLSSHLCISSFAVSLCHLSTVTSPPRRAAWSGDRLACSRLNNSFVTLRLFVLQRRRLRPAILKI